MEKHSMDWLVQSADNAGYSGIENKKTKICRDYFSYVEYFEEIIFVFD